MTLVDVVVWVGSLIHVLSFCSSLQYFENLTLLWGTAGIAQARGMRGDGDDLDQGRGQTPGNC